MKQDFKAVVCDGKRLLRLEPAAYGVPIAFGKNSVIGSDNHLANAVYTLLSRTPLRVCWMGELADDPFRPVIVLYADALTEEEFLSYYRTALDNTDTKREIPPSKFNVLELQTAVENTTVGRYLVNHSLRCYIDMGSYIQANLAYGRCPDPLALLTACGNGRGEKDYPITKQGAELVGSWAFHLLSYTSQKPGGEYRVECPRFETVGTSDSLVGKVIVVTGTFPSYTRMEVESLIQEAGAKMGTSVTRRTDFLVVAEKPGATKLKKADDLGIKKISADEFFDMLDN